MPVGLHADRASRKFKGNALSSQRRTSVLRDDDEEASLFLNAVIEDELKKTANYHEFIYSTFLVNDDKDCSREVAEWISKSSSEDDDNVTLRDSCALTRAYWRLPQNAKRHKKSIAGLNQFSRVPTTKTKINTRHQRKLTPLQKYSAKKRECISIHF